MPAAPLVQIEGGDRYRAGELDIIINGLPKDQIDWLKQNMPKELHLVPIASVVNY